MRVTEGGANQTAQINNPIECDGDLAPTSYNELAGWVRVQEVGRVRRHVRCCATGGGCLAT